MNVLFFYTGYVKYLKPVKMKRKKEYVYSFFFFLYVYVCMYVYIGYLVFRFFTHCVRTRRYKRNVFLLICPLTLQSSKYYWL